MRYMEFDWRVLLRQNATWDALPRSARETFLDNLQPTPITPKALGTDGRVLAEAGYAEPGPEQPKVRLPKRYVPVRDMLRSLRANPAPSDQDPFARDNYLDSQFDSAEIAAFRPRDRGSMRLFNLSSFDTITWNEEFLACEDHHAWECEHGLLPRRGAPRVVMANPYFPSGEVFALTKSIWHWLSHSPGPQHLQDLLDQFQQHSLAQLAAALRGGVRYLILFPVVDPKTLRLRVGLLSRVLRWLQREPVSMPGPVDVPDPFQAPYLIADMRQLLALCQAEPPRLRTDDGGLYVRTSRSLLERATPVPPEFADLSPSNDQDRMECAKEFLLQLGLARTDHTTGRNQRLVITSSGRAWLGREEKAQLVSVIDFVRDGLVSPDTPAPARKHASRGAFTDDSLLDDSLRDDGLRDDDFLDDDFMDDWCEEEPQLLLPPLAQEKLRAALAPARGPSFRPLPDYLAYAAEDLCPLSGNSDEDEVLLDIFAWPFHTHGLGKDRVSAVWREILQNVLRRLLFPLGGIELARLADHRLAFRITAIGEFILRWRSDFDYGSLRRADIIVQPNFEIVFLSPSALAAGTISRFAEQVGRNARSGARTGARTGARSGARSGARTGTLFKITRSSIFAAAATGSTRQDVLTALRELSAKPLPANVTTEIEGWFAQCRRVRIAAAVIIECPDEDTARRVLAAGKNLVRPLGDRIVELREGHRQGQLVRRLRKEGLFASQ